MARKSTARHLVTEQVVNVARDWFVESFHLQFDDAIKVGAVVLIAHGDELVALVIAAATMLVSLLALAVVHYAVKVANNRPTKPAPMTANEVIFEAEFVAMLREREGK